MKTHKPTKIKSVAELIALTSDEPVDCFISLSGGMARSSKSIMYFTDEKKFSIVNEIDDTEQVLTEKQLFNEKYTNVGIALLKGALFKY